jgi:hypothetical protein
MKLGELIIDGERIGWENLLIRTREKVKALLNSYSTAFSKIHIQQI